MLIFLEFQIIGMDFISKKLDMPIDPKRKFR